MIAIFITLIYFFSFAQFWRSSWSTNPISQELSNKIIFAAFMAGCYTDVLQNDYLRDISPFYVILALLVCERIAQSWLLDRFGCDEELCRKY
jgi:hypothetical protein